VCIPYIPYTDTGIWPSGHPKLHPSISLISITIAEVITTLCLNTPLSETSTFAVTCFKIFVWLSPAREHPLPISPWCHYCPRKTGLRFSAKARGPSLASSLACIFSPMKYSKASAWSSGMLSERVAASLMALTARGPFSHIF